MIGLHVVNRDRTYRCYIPDNNNTKFVDLKKLRNKYTRQTLCNIYTQLIQPSFSFDFETNLIPFGSKSKCLNDSLKEAMKFI